MDSAAGWNTLVDPFCYETVERGREAFSDGMQPVEIDVVEGGLVPSKLTNQL